MGITGDEVFDVIMWAIGVLVLIGFLYGIMITKLNRIEKMLGKNGTDGVFVRRDEYRVVREAQADLHANILERITQLTEDMKEVQINIAKIPNGRED